MVGGNNFGSIIEQLEDEESLKQRTFSDLDGDSANSGGELSMVKKKSNLMPKQGTILECLVEDEENVSGGTNSILINHP